MKRQKEKQTRIEIAAELQKEENKYPTERKI